LTKYVKPEMLSTLMGRPSKYTQSLADEICERLSKGEPLAWICRGEGKPTTQTVNAWVRDNESFGIAYARAREEGFDEIAMDCLHIADETGQDTKYTDSGEQADSEWITRSRLRVETRLKLLAKWSPKKYGDKIEHDHQGGIKVEVLKNW